MADAFGHAAAQAPQPMHAAASIARSASCFGIGIEFASGADPARAEMKSARLHDPIERAAIDHQILDDRKRSYAKRLDDDLFAVAKFSHVKFAGRAGMIRPVRFAVDGERARAANALAAIGVERDRFFAATEQLFVHDVEHLEKRSIRRNIGRFVFDELAARSSVFFVATLSRGSS